MPLDTIWFAGVVTAFAVFAIVMYWAERRTRNLSK